MASRFVRPGLFLVALLCFALPFADVSCAASDSESSRGTGADASAVASGVGATSLLLLAGSGQVRLLGLARVHWKVGYWLCLAALAAAGGASMLELRGAEPAPDGASQRRDAVTPRTKQHDRYGDESDDERGDAPEHGQR